MASYVRNAVFCPPRPLPIYDPDDEDMCDDLCRSLYRQTGVALVVARNPDARAICISLHGNSENHVTALEYARVFGERTGSTVYVVDYPAFFKHKKNAGEAHQSSKDEHLPSEAEVYAAATTAFRAVLAGSKKAGLPCAVIGYSLGTASAVQCAVTPEAIEEKTPIVLIAPLLSAISTQTRQTENAAKSGGLLSYFLGAVDMFGTERDAPKIVSPTLIYHGRHDIAVPFAHGERLSQLIKGSMFRPFDEAQHDTIREYILDDEDHLCELRLVLRRGAKKQHQR